MKNYRTISLRLVGTQKRLVEVYDFMEHTTLNLPGCQTIGDAIDLYNVRGFFVTAVDHIMVDPEKDDRIVIMTKEGRSE